MSITHKKKTNIKQLDGDLRGLNFQQKFLGVALSALLCNTALFGMKTAHANEKGTIQLASAAKYSSTINVVTAKQYTVDSLYDLALKYLDGDDEGMSKNEARAIKLLENAAERGFAKAQYTLGILHADEDEEEVAVFWLRKAADQGHEDALFVYNTILNSDYNIGC